MLLFSKSGFTCIIHYFQNSLREYTKQISCQMPFRFKNIDSLARRRQLLVHTQQTKLLFQLAHQRTIQHPWKISTKPPFTRPMNSVPFNPVQALCRHIKESSVPLNRNTTPQNPLHEHHVGTSKDYRSLWNDLFFRRRLLWWRPPPRSRRGLSGTVI